jgi:CRISPR-associated protein Csm5
MKEKKQTRTWEITLLTPLHVGDGENLIQNMDYISVKEGLSVIHLDTVLNSISDNPRAVSDLARMDLAQFIKSYSLKVQPDYTLPVKGANPREVRRFLKNAYGEPYLAGTTLKGAIRTALWTTLDRSGIPPVRDFRKFETAVHKLDGEPHTDFLRPLAISDSIGLKPDGALAAEEIKFFNIQTGNKPGWKDFSSKRTLDRFQDAAGLFVEALKPGTRVYAKVELSQFLRSEPMRSLWPIPGADGLDDFESFAGVINAYSKKLAMNERGFFAGYGPAAAGVTAFYDDLVKNGFEHIKDMPGTFFLRMAWGSGWKGMTGDWIHGRDLEAVRQERKLGKQGVPIFPKTRRLAMKDGSPVLPMGWAFVKPAADNLFAPRASSPSGKIAPAARSEKSGDVPRTDSSKKPAASPEQVQSEILKQFQFVVANSKNLPGEIGFFTQKIIAQTDETLQKEMCKVLLAKGESLDKKKKFSKALAEGKKWAQDLKMLCEKYGVKVI